MLSNSEPHTTARLASNSILRVLCYKKYTDLDTNRTGAPSDIICVNTPVLYHFPTKVNLDSFDIRVAKRDHISDYVENWGNR
jgi:hypothetical protein